MRSKSVSLWVAILLSASFALGQQVVPASGILRFEGAERPDVLGWVVEGRDEAVVERLRDDKLSVSLPVGAGCLALLREDSVPILLPIEIEKDSEQVLAELEWREGPVVTGQVVDPGDLPVPATIRLQEEARPGKPSSERCAQALESLGFYEVRAGANGRFQTLPLLAGRYRLTIEARDHATKERLLVVSSAETGYDLGTVIIELLARVEVVVDASEINEQPPFELMFEEKIPTEIVVKDSWKRVYEGEAVPDTPVQVETRPGEHRLTLRKAGTGLDYTTIETLTPGWQEIVLRPEPIFIEGRITANDLPVEDAEVVFMWENLKIETSSNQDGEYSVTVWVPAYYGAFVKASDGGNGFESIDLREAEPGETHELNFDLGLASISGRVVSAEDQRPIEGCRVSLELKTDDRSAHRSTTTSPGGEFAFEGLSLADTTRLTAVAEGFLYREMELTFVGEDVSGVWIELEESSSVRGRVIGPAGEPAVGIEVGCCPAADRQSFTVETVTAVDGSFEIDTLPGEVLFATAEGYALGWAIARDGDETMIHLQPLPQPTRVRVQTEAGEPIPRLPLTYVSDAGVVLPSNLVFRHAYINALDRSTDSEGVIQIASLPPGVYQVFGGRGEEASPLGTLPIPSSGEVTFRFSGPKRAEVRTEKVALAGR